LQCGFGSLANFNRRFREITRMSPRDYRRQLRRSAAPPVKNSIWFENRGKVGEVSEN
jgi:AraC-like DNA-binding protein